MAIKAPKGTKDMLPQDAYRWQYIEKEWGMICSEYGFREVRTPAFEATELFNRGIGETTDVVQKEMYTFEDMGGRSITLKPEGTSPAVRAFIENNIYAETQPTKIWYDTPCFRYEKPQAGRLREFHQFGIENFGTAELANCTISGNNAKADGGGICNGQTLTLDGGSVTNNTAANGTGHGIFVCKKGMANVVTGNTITNAKLYGVITSEGGKINTLKGNTISTTDAKNGISIIANTKTYIEKITGNKISGRYNCGIRVKSPTKKMYVTSNVLKCGNPKGKRSSGVSVEFAKKGISIKKNKITGNGTGIGIFTRSSKASISGNKLVRTGGKIGRA